MKNYSLLFVSMILTFQAFSQWSSDPAENSAIYTGAGEQVIPKVATSDDGTTYISWFSSENGNYNVRLQKLDVYGNKMWADEGLLVSDHESMSWLTDWDMTVDQNDFAILTFQDVRTGNNNIYTYRISPDGDFIWGADGIALSNNEAFEAAPKVCVTNSGNAVFAWQSDDVIIMQKVAPDGTLLWGDNGITLSGANTYSWPQLLPVGNDDVIMKYFEDSGPTWAPTRHVFAMRYNSDGNNFWVQPAVISDAGGISAWTQIFPFINDGMEGFYIAWHDDRDNDMKASIFVQHISADGAALFEANGVEASLNSTMNHFYANLALTDGSDDIFVYWNEMDADQNLRGIFGQKFTSSGARQWTDNGKSIIDVSSVNVYPVAARAAGQDMIVFYEEYFDAVKTSVKAMKLDSDGNFVWASDKVTLSSVQSEKLHPDINELNNGQWIAVWGDNRNSDTDIYGQNIQPDGSLGTVTIPGNLEIYPDTVVCDYYGPFYVHILNNTSEAVTIESAFFSDYFCIVTYPDPDQFPYVINAGDSLAMETEVIPGCNTNDGYLINYLQIATSVDIYQVVYYVNEDLLGSVSEQDINQLNVFPNPSAGNVTFQISNGLSSNSSLEIHNSVGEKVRSFKISDGTQKIEWDRRDNKGNMVKPGFYFYNIGSLSGKIILF